MLDLRGSQQIVTPEAVIFDTDNTLYPYEPAHKAAIKSVATKTEELFGVNESDFMEAFKISRTEVKKRLKNTASSHSRLLYFQRTIEHLDMGTRILTTLDLEQTYWRTFFANARLFPGVKEFLQELKNHGVKTANITDLTSQIQFRKMVYFGLDEYFDYVVTSEESGVDKPNPLCFEIALEKIGLPSSSKIWMIGDDHESDIKGGNSFGLTTLHKVDRLSLNDNTADIIFDNFNHLCKFYSNL